MLCLKRKNYLWFLFANNKLFVPMNIPFLYRINESAMDSQQQNQFYDYNILGKKNCNKTINLIIYFLHEKNTIRCDFKIKESRYLTLVSLS